MGKYSQDMVSAAVHMVEDEGLSVREASEATSIPESSVYYYLRKYRSRTVDVVPPPPPAPELAPSNVVHMLGESVDVEALIRENALLGEECLRLRRIVKLLINEI